MIPLPVTDMICSPNNNTNSEESSGWRLNTSSILLQNSFKDTGTLKAVNNFTVSPDKHPEINASDALIPW